MTQKELAYIEDAIGHETNIIKIITDMMLKLDDQTVITFLNNEQNKHNTIREDLLSIMEAKINE